MTQAALSIRLARRATPAPSRTCTTLPGARPIAASSPGRELERMVSGAGRAGGATPSTAAAASPCWNSTTPCAAMSATAATGSPCRPIAARSSSSISARISGPRLRPAPVRRRPARSRGHRAEGLIVWALADNERACGFYRHLGGIRSARWRSASARKRASASPSAGL